MGKSKLELTWVGKDERPRLEPRVLIEDPELSHRAAAGVGGESPHYKATAGGYDVQVNAGYVAFPPRNFAAAEDTARNCRAPVDDLGRIRGMVFDGFLKCLYPRLKVKADNAMGAPDVIAKANAAASWCRLATDHAADTNGKPWQYLLVKESRIGAARTFGSVAAEHAYRQ